MRIILIQKQIMMLRVSDNVFLFVSAGCVQRISSVSLKCVQPSVAILLTARWLVYILKY